MRVKTDIRAGSVLDEAAAEAGKLVDGINALLNEASSEAQGLVNNANLAATSAWNAVKSTISP